MYYTCSQTQQHPNRDSDYFPNLISNTGKREEDYMYDQ